SATHPHLHAFPTRRSSDLSFVVFIFHSFQPIVPQLFLCLRFVETKLALNCPLKSCLLRAPYQWRFQDSPSHFWGRAWWSVLLARSEEHTSELQSRENLVCR